MKKKMLVVSILSLKTEIPHFTMFWKDEDGFRTHDISASGTQLWVLTYDGTIEGLHNALVITQNNSDQLKSIEAYITNLFRGELTDDKKARINKFVKDKASWTMFNVLESVTEP